MTLAIKFFGSDTEREKYNYTKKALDKLQAWKKML